MFNQITFLKDCLKGALIFSINWCIQRNVIVPTAWSSYSSKGHAPLFRSNAQSSRFAGTVLFNKVATKSMKANPWLVKKCFLFEWICFSLDSELHHSNCHVLVHGMFFYVRYVSDHAYNGFKAVCQRKLLHSLATLEQQNLERHFPPCLLEWISSKNCARMALPFAFPDGKGFCEKRRSDTP